MAAAEFVRLLAAGGLFCALLAASVDAYAIHRPPASTASAQVGAVARGRALFQAKGCVACHTVAGVPGNAQVGPNLTGLPLVAGTRKPGMAAADYVRESLVDPQAF